MADVVCAVDVGTRSARAAILSRDGTVLGRADHAIALSEPRPNHAEHDSEDIWRAVCAAARAAREVAGVSPQAVVGIAFDATCSLVLRDRAGAPLGISAGKGEGRRDTIAWLDHRAIAEAAECTASGHRVLDFVGGVMSPEMEIPKLMWLKRHRRDAWSRLGYAFDLTDFLAWRATGSTARSQCTLTCKWTYLAHETPGWQADFLARMGLADLIEKTALPKSATPVGFELGTLKAEAADDLGLTTDCRVAAGLIDAYAGALGVIGAHVPEPGTLGRHLALIAGTSSCVMAMAAEPRPINGFWGPYFGVAIPGIWMSEGGQSATGALLDHIIRMHEAGGEPDRALHTRIAARLQELRAVEGADFAARLHILPDFHGNRTPFADPHAVGVISGLTLDASFDGLCRLYFRACGAIALGVRQILEALNAGGERIDTLHVTGGHTRNQLLMELYADATGCTVAEPLADDAVLLGTGMAAACGAGWFGSLREACAAMRQPVRERRPNAAARATHDRDYRIFLEMQRQRAALDAIR